jgi:hypothetical protein
MHLLGFKLNHYPELTGLAGCLYKGELAGLAAPFLTRVAGPHPPPFGGRDRRAGSASKLFESCRRALISLLDEAGAAR